MSRTPSPQVRRRSIGSVLAVAAFALSASAVQGQGLSSWKLESQEASAAYHDAIERAEFERRASQHKASLTLLRTLESELTKARRRRDQGGTAALTKALEAARQAGRVPPPRPKDLVSFGGHDYALIEPGRTWHEAKADCERLGGHLLLLDTAEEEAFVLSKWKEAEFWIGATDLYTPDEFRRIDGAAFRPFAAPFRPDNFRQGQSAVGWYAPNADWNDFDDGSRLAYVCEWE